MRNALSLCRLLTSTHSTRVDSSTSRTCLRLELRMQILLVATISVATVTNFVSRVVIESTIRINRSLVLDVFLTASRVDDLDTTLNRLILDHEPTLKRRYSRQLVVLRITNVITNVELIIEDLIDYSRRITRAKNNDQVVVVTQLVRADELVDTVIRSLDSLLIIEHNRSNACRSCVVVFLRRDLADQLRTTKDGNRHILIVKNLQEVRNLSIEVIHEGLITPCDVGAHVVVIRNEVECTRDRRGLREVQERFVKLLEDLVILVVYKGELHHAEDLRELVRVVHSLNVTSFLGRDRNRDMRSIGDLEVIRTCGPLNLRRIVRCTRRIESSTENNSLNVGRRAHERETVLMHRASDLEDLTTGRCSICSRSNLHINTLLERTVILTISSNELNRVNRENSLLQTNISSSSLLNRLRSRVVELVTLCNPNLINDQLSNTGRTRKVRNTIRNSTEKSENIRLLIFRQLDNNILARNSRLNDVLNLILLEEHINLTVVNRAVQRTSLHRESELRACSNILRNSTLVEHRRHKKVLMHRERDTNRRVETTKRSSLHEALKVMLKESTHCIVMLFNSLRALHIRIVHIERLTDEEVLHLMLESRVHKELGRLSEYINLLGETCLANSKELFSKRTHRIFAIEALKLFLGDGGLLAYRSTN
nr:MAG TPA: hypothetical protein [Caudoviricetes sp.]